MKLRRLAPMGLCALFALQGCTTPAAPTLSGGPGDGGVEGTAGLVELDAPRLLRRMSLDLLGVLPPVEDLDAVEADPTALSDLRDAMLEDPRLEERLVQLFAERWHTQVDEFLIIYMEYQEYAYDWTNEFPFERSIGDEPLRLMARIVVEDRPWSEVATADFTMANEVLGAIWPLDYPQGQTGWSVAHYTDGRPPAGVLATNGLWWRYYSTFSNYNRGRIAAISRLLLCEDYVARPVTLGEGGLSLGEEGVEDALRENPYCMGCHASLDPAAAALFGFWPTVVYNADELHTYHPDRERLGEEMLGVEMAWMGTPIEGLQDLGQAIAQDPRLSRCAAESMAQTLWGRPVTVSDYAAVEGVRQAFEAEGGRMKTVLRAVTDTAEYRAGALAEDATDAQEQAENTTRLMTAALLSSALSDLTGFSWTWNRFDQLANDTWGFRVLAGGVDGVYLREPQRVPSASWTLVVGRAAEAASSHLVQQGLADGDFAAVDLQARPGEPAFDQLLEDLHWRLYAVRPTDEQLAAATALWQQVESREGSSSAWQALLTALLRDPAFTSY